MSTLNLVRALKKMFVNEIKDFIFENYYKRIEFSKEISYYLMKGSKRKYLLLLTNKLIEKVPHPRNAKEHYESFLMKKNRKSVKQSEIITYYPKTFDTVDIKSVITEHPETSHKLPNNIRPVEEVDPNDSLYSDIKKSENFLKEKNMKITKREHAFKGYASTYIVEILSFFNRELQLKETESATKSKLIKLLNQLKGFKFLTTLVLVFKKMESKDKTTYGNFYSSSKAKIIITEKDIDNVFKSI